MHVWAVHCRRCITNASRRDRSPEAPKGSGRASVSFVALTHSGARSRSIESDRPPPKSSHTLIQIRGPKRAQVRLGRVVAFEIELAPIRFYSTTRYDSDRAGLVRIAGNNRTTRTSEHGRRLERRRWRQCRVATDVRTGTAEYISGRCGAARPHSTCIRRKVRPAMAAARPLARRRVRVRTAHLRAIGAHCSRRISAELRADRYDCVIQLSAPRPRSARGPVGAVFARAQVRVRVRIGARVGVRIRIQTAQQTLPARLDL